MKAADKLVNPTCVSEDNLANLSQDKKLPVESVAAVMTSLATVLLGSARDELDHTTLNYELLQLGTPKEHAGAISRLYKEKRGQLILATQRDSCRLSRLLGVSWRVDNQVRLREGEVGLEKVVRMDLEVEYSKQRVEQR